MVYKIFNGKKIITLKDEYVAFFRKYRFELESSYIEYYLSTINIYEDTKKTNEELSNIFTILMYEDLIVYNDFRKVYNDTVNKRELEQWIINKNTF